MFTIEEVNIILTIVATISISTVFFLIYIMKLRKKHLSLVEKMAYYDEITGLPNLNKFKLEAQEIMDNNPDKVFIIVKFDIVNFKAINEIFDFSVGNKVLEKIAEVKKFVDNEYFLKSRVGSDEFLIFADDKLLLDLESATIKYEQIFKELVPDLEIHKFEFRYGRYIVPKDEKKDINDIVNKVTMAHGLTKISSGSKIIDYDDSFKESVIKFTEITNKMQRALLNEEFKIYLQPKVRISDFKVVGAEALVRWIEDDGMMIYPNEFIPLFEKNGFIVKLDMYMFERACMLIKSWLTKGEKCVPIAVNFSRLNLLNSNLINELNCIIDKYDVPKKYIEIELTETLVAENEEDLKELFDKFHKEGFVVSIDDFGAGHSSLGMLKNYKADTLKLDRSFLINSKGDVRGDVVVSGIIKLAHDLNMDTVAEGVEKKDQLDFLQTIDCYAAQGYYFSKPLQVSEFAAKYL